jgi:Spy/CpxP family protein refolding chaperone
MKKTVTALTLGAILIPAAVFAGNHFGGHYFGERHDGHRLARMAEHLQLSEQQQTQVQQIFTEQRDKRTALREETRSRIDAVLSEEQRAKVQTWREQRHKGFCARHGMKPQHES